jgi:hypothetical protein
MRSIVTLLATIALGSIACGSDTKEPQKDLAADTKPWPDVRGADEPFGRACTNLGKECPDKDPAGFTLLCIGVAGGTAGKGYCSRTCTDVGTECEGAANGQKAGCFVAENAGDAGPGNKFCGFLCKSKANFWTCPGSLSCGKPDKDGVAICLP